MMMSKVQGDTTYAAPSWSLDTTVNTENFTIKSQSFSTGFSQGNEGALATDGETVFIVHREGQISTLNERDGLLSIQNVQVLFQDLIQRVPGERGLPGVKGALYVSSEKSLYVSATYIQNNCAHLNVYKFKWSLSTSQLSNSQLIFSTPTCAPLPQLPPLPAMPITAVDRQGQPNISQAGGKLVYIPQLKTVLLSIGNFGDDWKSISQVQSLKSDTRFLFGKTVLLEPKQKYVVFTTGHRNPSGMVWDPTTKKVIEAENGPEGGDELNVLSQGKDYGWPLVSLGHRYSNPDGTYSSGLSTNQPPKYQTLNTTGLVQPIFAWNPSIAPSNIAVMPSSLSLHIPGATELLVGTYKDQSLHHILIFHNSVIFDERIYLGYRIRDLVFANNNHLFIFDDIGNIHELSFIPRVTSAATTTTVTSAATTTTTIPVTSQTG